MDLTLPELVVSSSIQLYQADSCQLKPVAFGSGFVVSYLGGTFLVSVSHVTDTFGLVTYLETNLPTENGTTPIRPIGGIVYYDLFKITDEKDLKDFGNLIEKAERLDISFARIEHQFTLLQPAIDFGAFQIRKGEKVLLNLEYATMPNKSEEYAFYGKVRQNYDGPFLRMTHAFKHGLKFHRTSGYFHMFLAPEIITDVDDYRGCSGAPIFDSEGRVVAIACKVVQNTKIVYGFSIQECMKLMKISVDIDQL